MSVILQSSGGGQITLQEPTTASNFTQTLPSASGTVMVSGNMPAFSAFASSATSLANSANTILIYDVKDFDTATCYNNTGSTVTLNGISVPAYSFAPNVAGYYQINASHYVSRIGGSTNTAIQIFKNNGGYGINSGASSVTNLYMQASMLVYCNGTSDYVSVALYWEGAGASTGSGAYRFQGCLVRAA